VRRKRCNLEKQEEVVAALWRFAADLQLRPNKGCVATTASGPNTGTKASLDHVGSALRSIMETFGYGVLEIQ
jgi:hypothetical protein